MFIKYYLTILDCNNVPFLQNFCAILAKSSITLFYFEYFLYFCSINNNFLNLTIMADEKDQKPYELNEEQLDNVAGGKCGILFITRRFD